MKKRTIKIIISVAASVVVLTAGIVAATGNYLPANRVSAPDMKYSVGVKVGEMTAGYVPVGIGVRGDANGDGNLSAADAAYIASYRANVSLNADYMSGYEDSLNGAMADADSNGKVSAADAACIAKFLAMRSINADITWEEVLGIAP